MTKDFLRPHMGRINGHPVLMVDGKPLILLAGEVHNSNSSSLAYMEQVWEKADEDHTVVRFVTSFATPLSSADGLLAAIKDLT